MIIDDLNLDYFIRHELKSADRVDVRCNCGSVTNIKVATARQYIKRNGEGPYLCHACRNKINAPDTAKKLRAMHKDTVSERIKINCDICGREVWIIRKNYRANKRRNDGLYVCTSCATSRAHADGKFDHVYTDDFRNKLRESSDKFWSEARVTWRELIVDDEFRRKMSECGKRAWTDEFREKMAHFMLGNDYGKLAWTDEFREKMSELMKERGSEFGKLAWTDEFRERMKERWSGFGKLAWTDEFRERVGLREFSHSDDAKLKISESSKRLWKDDQYAMKVSASVSKAIGELWQDDEYRLKMINDFKERWSDEDYRKAIINSVKSKWADGVYDHVSSLTSDKWKDEEFRSKMIRVVTMNAKKAWENPEYRNYMSAIALERWNDEEYRNKMSEVLSRRWEDDEFREKMVQVSKDNWNDEEYRNKMSEVLSRRWEDDEFREKMVQVSKDNWKNEEYRNRMIEVVRKMWEDDEFREKMARVRLSQPKTSFQQEILYSILDDLNIQYFDDKSDRCMIGYYTFDCRIDPQDGLDLSSPLLIEVQGDYWHSLPNTRAKDKSKSTYLKKYFPDYDLKYIWEHEFNNKDRVIDLIRYWVGVSNVDVVDFNFGDVDYFVIDNRQAEIFVSKYHYAGRIGRRGLCVGAHYDGRLVAVCVFSPVVRKECADLQGVSPRNIMELSRFCIHPQFQKRNFASWFISRSIKLLGIERPNVSKVISFADSTYNHDGGIYKASNFYLDGVVKPDYWYVDADGYVIHKKTLYNHARKMSMKESDYVHKYNYKKVWGGEKYRYVINLKSN